MNALLRLLSQHKIAKPAKKFVKPTKRATHHQPLLGSRQAPLPRRRTPPPTRSSSATMRRIQFKTTATITLHCRVHNLPRKAVSILFNRLPGLLLFNYTTVNRQLTWKWENSATSRSEAGTTCLQRAKLEKL